ncbi:strawberry notch family protein [Candidatus Dependentiae bacterium]|nr:strawberry notch family protein [Candidatus Dependentiae bacterium]
MTSCFLYHSQVYSHARRGGQRALWISVSGDLKFDAERDLRDLGIAQPTVHVFPKGNGAMPAGEFILFAYGTGNWTDVVFLFTGDLNKMTRSGVVFCTYSLLIQGGGRVADLGKDGVDLNALLMKPGSRLEQLVSWLGEDKHGPLVVFDECHRAKNLVNENGTFICISVRAISMTGKCFVYRRAHENRARRGRPPARHTKRKVSFF